MSRESFERIVLRDFGVAALLASAVIGLGLVAPAIVVGAVCLVLIPVVGVAVIAHNFMSHRWDDSSQPGTDHAHTSDPETAHSLSEAPTAHEPVDLSGRLVRPDLSSAWTDHAWATYWTALRRWSRTRPGR